ncbi:5'/3'-nucleotidase SurE [Pseudoxanthobacter sp. M-2]|uniref:5'/3'-nucleotidase SurE n=1 Tax=Pseudoxanthobacter sp. M-2 TaxID=3078754 RepID=UPI0038FC710B
MRILITNDDGIHAPGLKTLETIARALSDDVWVVAPETDQSGSAHSLTLSDPLRVREVSKQHFAVKGTPTDCVIIALKNLMKSPPDLVLSGVNRGQNLAEDVTYSGTVAGAMEGTLLGVRSIALSQAYSAATRGQPRYETAEALGPELVDRLAKIEVPPGTLFNVNFPDREPDGVTGVAVTTQGRRDQELLSIDARMDGRGFPYYWIVFGRSPFETVEGSDLRAIAEGKISVTPLRLDLTAHELRAKLAASIER